MGLRRKPQTTTRTKEVDGGTYDGPFGRPGRSGRSAHIDLNQSRDAKMANGKCCYAGNGRDFPPLQDIDGQIGPNVASGGLSFRISKDAVQSTEFPGS